MSRRPPTPDNGRWTVDYASSNGATAKVRDDSARRLVVLGYITAIAMPLIGFILGIVVATRPGSKANSRHGVWIIVVSLVASVVWILVFTSGVLTATSNDLNY
jgi:hypothetical protein